MHAWLHSCGNIEKLLPRFIEMGLDVIHPIQKYAMDETAVIHAYGGKIAFWAGFDVQRIIPYGTPDEVRREVRHLMDTYARPDGRFLLTAGNGITPDTPLESLCALFEESHAYGKTKGRTVDN
jgi:uroporphyrinogen-III decarboxylase